MDDVMNRVSTIGDRFPKTEWGKGYSDLCITAQHGELLLKAMVEFEFDYEEPDKPENCLQRHCWRLLSMIPFPQVIPALAELVEDGADNAEVDFPYVIGNIGEPGMDEVTKLMEGAGSFVQTLCVFGLYFTLRANANESVKTKQALRTRMDHFETNADSVNTALAVVGSRLDLSEFSEPLQKIVDSGRFENSGPMWEMFQD